MRGVVMLAGVDQPVAQPAARCRARSSARMIGAIFMKFGRAPAMMSTRRIGSGGWIIARLRPITADC